MSLAASRILITQAVRKEDEVPRNDENMAIERNVLPETPHGKKKIASMVRLSLQSRAHKSSKTLGKLSMKVANCRLRIRFRF